MNRPLAASAEAEEELEWQVASRRRKAWAKCRSSWQASETEDLSTEATTQDEDEDDEEDLPDAKLPAAAGRGGCGRARVARSLPRVTGPADPAPPRAPGPPGGPLTPRTWAPRREAQAARCPCRGRPPPGSVTAVPCSARRKRAQREDRDMAQGLPVSAGEPAPGDPGEQGSRAASALRTGKSAGG